MAGRLNKQRNKESTNGYYLTNARSLKGSTNSFLGLLDFPVESRNPIIDGYLCVRTNDIIEDDLALNRDEEGLKKKKELMGLFVETFRDNSGDKLHQFASELMKLKTRDKKFHRLIENIGSVFGAYQTFHPKIKRIIFNRIKEQSEGLASKNIQDIHTQEDYHEYCHYSVGIIGYMIAELLNATGHLSLSDLEKVITDETTIRPGVNPAHDFGIALQIFNDIRDLHEDVSRGIFKWPKELLEKRSLTYGDLVGLSRQDDKNRRTKADWVLEDMIEDGKKYLMPGIDFVDSLPYEPLSFRKTFGGVYAYTAAFCRIANDKILYEDTEDPDFEEMIRPFLYDKDKRNISSDELKLIGNVVEDLTKRKIELRGFIEHLIEKPAEEFKLK